MPVKLTQKQADELDRSIGAIPIGKYVNHCTKREYKCTICNNIYVATPGDIRRYKRTMCKKCGHQTRSIKLINSVDNVQKIVISKGFKPLFTEYIGRHNKLKIRCQCGKVFFAAFNDIQTNNTKSCGHCNDPIIGDRFHSLTITHIKPSKSTSCSVKCQCDCGREIGWNKFAYINRGSITTCGKCNNPNVGDRFGKLTITKVIPSINSGCQVEVVCDCGNVDGPYPITCITRTDKMGNRSCGNCGISRNGRATSNIALELHNIIEQILGQKCEHNYHIQDIGCIDIVNTEQKIAIEYDGFYWHRIHKDQSQRDKDKYKKLVANGWKLLNIKSGGTDLPPENQLRKILLNHFQHGSKKRTITMDSWKRANKKLKGEA